MKGEVVILHKGRSSTFVADSLAKQGLDRNDEFLAWLLDGPCPLFVALSHEFSDKDLRNWASICNRLFGRICSKP